ncbi:MAG TPA: amino acid permease [Candidatus Dormibacteraeota bacterium]|nr:amino acid permease [Candidatus Dormibacteraeota bacterium]
MGKPSEPVAFVRTASGLRRDVSFLDVVTLNLSNMSGGAALGVIGFTTVLLSSMSGVNLVYGSILAWLLSIPQIIVYTMMTTRVSRTGGDYVWVSRVLGGLLGGPLSFMGYTLETMAYAALIALAAVFAIGSVGVSLGYSNMLPLSLPGNLPGANQLGQFLIAALVFVALIVINVVKPKLGYKVVAFAVMVAILATFVGIFTLLVAGRTGVQNYMSFLNSIGSNTTYTAVANSYTGPTFDFGATIFMLPFFAIFVYPWLNAGPAVASEIKGKGALRYNVFISSLVTLIVVTAGFAAMYYAGGLNFINGALANSTLVFDYSFNFWTLAMGVSSIPAVSWFIGLGWVLWNVAIMAYAIIVESRYLFAQSFDRFLPEKISHISLKYGSPTVALLIYLVGTVVLIGLASFFYGTLTALYGAVVAAMIYFFFIGVAGVVYALKNEKGRSKAILATAGLLMAIVFAYITYQFLAFASIWGGNPIAYGWVVSSFIAGIVIYMLSKSYYSKRGIDITLAYKELPPL